MKKTAKILVTLLVIAAMAFTLTACGGGNDKQQEEKIVFGTNAEFPPFEFVASKGVIGEFDGIDIAIADQIAKDNGMVAEIANMEFDSLLIALENGPPCEDRVIGNAFNRLKKKADLPDVGFHSLRHSSTTY